LGVPANIALFLVLLALYVPTLAKGVTFSDGPEIAAAIVTLAVIHPTGYPLFTLLAHFFERWVPVPGEPCYRIALFNACAAAAAALFLAASVRRWGRHMAWREPGPRSERFELWLAVSSFATALFYGLSPLLWSQVRIPEVYPFHILLVSWSLYQWTRYETRGRRPGDIVWTALPMGLGLAHHVTIVYMLPAAFVYLLLTRPRFFIDWLVWPWARLLRSLGKPKPALEQRISPKPGYFLLACLVGGLPLLCYLYLIWANSHTTGVPWGGVHDLKSMFDHMTGVQYRQYMKGFGYPGLWKRLQALPGGFYEILFAPGVLLIVIGLFSALRKAPAFAWFLLLYALFTIAHGLQYGVGDYKNYFLPAYAVFSLFLGVGTRAVLETLERDLQGWRQRAKRALPLLLAVVFVLMVYDVGAWQFSFNTLFGPTARVVVSVVAGVLGIAFTFAPQLLQRLHASVARAETWRRFGLAYVFVGFLGVLLLSVGMARGKQVSKRALVGAKHAASVARELTPGAIYMTMGDGFIFSQWYEQHALLDGIDSAVINVRRAIGGWYQRFLVSRYPAACDPLYGDLGRDPKRYAADCSNFEKRMALPRDKAWFKTPRADFRGGRSATRKPGAPYAEYMTRVLTGTEEKCKDKDYRTKQGDKCRCWGTDKEAYTRDDQCVPSLEGRGIVFRQAEEVLAERMVEDNINSRDVFERNIFTRWITGSKNSRKWDGPAYQRPSARYTMINRGRSNQFVFSKDLEGVDTCGETFTKVKTPALRPPSSSNPSIMDRAPYEPSDWPILVSQSFMSREPKDNSDKGTFEFRPGENVNLHIDWFERFHYDGDAPKHKGAALQHGVRFCAYDPNGKRIWTGSALSGAGNTALLSVPLDKSAPPGNYTLQACSVGEVKKGDKFDAVQCQRAVLEVGFEVQAKGKGGALSVAVRDEKSR
jgi:hypothetical protein